MQVVVYIQWESGGGVTEKNIAIKETYQRRADYFVFGPAYKIRKIPEICIDKCVYCGRFVNEYGHFIVDDITRLYYAVKNPNIKLAYILGEGEQIQLLPQIKRAFQLLGICIDNIYFINKPTKIQTLVVPEQSYVADKYYSDQYIEIIDTIARRIQPSTKQIYDSIYCSRSRYGVASTKEVGGDLIDNLFQKNKYKIIYPENESLDDQIYYINNCKTFAGMSGSIFHSIIFCTNKNIQVLCFNKCHDFNILLRDAFQIREIYPIYIDAYAQKCPVGMGHGPFFFVANKNFDKFVNDFHLHDIDNKFYSDKFLCSCIKFYLKRITYIIYFKKEILLTNDDNLDAKYFSPCHLNIWYLNYLKFECYGYVRLHKIKLYICNFIKKYFQSTR